MVRSRQAMRALRALMYASRVWDTSVFSVVLSMAANGKWRPVHGFGSWHTVV